MRFLLLLLLIAFPASGCRRHTAIKPPPAPANTLLPGMFITADCNLRHTEKDRTLTLKADRRSNAVHWNYTIAIRNRHGSGGSSGSGSAINLSSPSAPWFIYVEGPDRIWFFDGKDGLIYGIAEGNNFRSDASISGGQLEPKSATIPPEIIPRLPAELQKVVPAPSTKRRPSI